MNSESHQDSGPEPLAIIGIAFEFPQDATSDDAFWQMIEEGRSASTDFPSNRLNIDAFYHPARDRPSSIPLKGGNFVKNDISAFDAPFFSMSPAEASCVDPQHRRLLEVAYHALEDAGIPISKCSGSKTSVYTGSFTNDYLSVLQQDYQAEQRHGAMGIAPSMLANRLSWFFNLKGTSVNLDSACSSSLLALHLACQDLRSGNASMCQAIVGGANLVYHPNFMKLMSNSGFLSKDSRSWSFDQRANGYARGEGTAVLIVKRLADALRDGDTVRAIVRNTASNQDGRTPGITQPCQDSQIELIRSAYSQANLDMGCTRFFEAHGTGTAAGDPVEANAIGNAFMQYRTEAEPLYVGAVKANIGHLEGCSGLAGIIKTILVLERGTIPPIAGLEVLNSQIDPRKLRLHFPTQPLPWPPADTRRACVNSFGFGGTNVVAVLDDAYHFMAQNSLRGFHRSKMPSSPGRHDVAGRHRDEVTIGDNDCPYPEQDDRPRLLAWSASDLPGIQHLSSGFRRYVPGMNASELRDLAYTLAARRSQLDWRSFTITGPSTSSLEQPRISAPFKAVSGGQVAYVFTGQGSQYVGMGRALFQFPRFVESLRLSDAYLSELGCDWSLVDVLSGRDDEAHIHDAKMSQPLITCLQIALVDLLADIRVLPCAVVGHSSGEIAAAYSIGALDHVSAVKIAYYRGIVSSRLAESRQDMGMMAVGLSGEGFLPYASRLQDISDSVGVSIGCFNSPNSITLTGAFPQLKVITEWLKEDDVFHRKLQVSVAYHSKFMEAVCAEYGEMLRDLKPGTRPRLSIPMISTVTGDVADLQALQKAEYWQENLVRPVDLQTAFYSLLAFTNRPLRRNPGQHGSHSLHLANVLEIGPHRALHGPVREMLQDYAAERKPSYVASLVRGQDAAVTLLRGLGTLHCSGCPVDMPRVNGLDSQHPRPAPANMPRYPFNHQHKHWRESRISHNFRFQAAQRNDLLGMRSLDWNPQEAQWRNVLRLNEVPWMRDHRVNNDIVFPGAGFVVMALEALIQLFKDPTIVRGVFFEEVSFLRPIRFTEEQDQVETQLTLSSSGPVDGRPGPPSKFRIFAYENGSYLECANGLVRPVFDDEVHGEIMTRGPWTTDEWFYRISASCQEDERNLYDEMGGSSVTYGPAFQNIKHLCLGQSGEAIAQLDTSAWRSSASTGPSPFSTIHPCSLDGLAQLIVPALTIVRRDLPTMVPVRADSIWIDCSSKKLWDGQVRVLAECILREGHCGASADLVGTSNESNTPLVYLKGLTTAFIEKNPASSSEMEEPPTPRKLCTRMLWKPDLDMMDQDQIVTHCTRQRPPQEGDVLIRFRHQSLAIMAFVMEAIDYVDSEIVPRKLPAHLQSYVDWMRFQWQRLVDGQLPISLQQVQALLSDPKARKSLIINVSKTDAEGSFFMQIGQNLLHMLNGEVDPLHVMFHNGSAHRYYEDMLSSQHHAHPISAYVDLLCFKNPSMKILEIGAGTGGQTTCLLETMSKDNIDRWQTYDYTDISPSFFSEARTKFQHHSSKMNFKTCDVSQDPVSQGFDAASYDLVVASHVLHATQSLRGSLINIRKLLKPGGKLLLLETTAPDALLAFAFGLLKDWWSPLEHEERSRHSPCVPVQQWDHLLRTVQFSGVDFEIPGQGEAETRYSSIMIATAADGPVDHGLIPPEVPGEVIILVNHTSEPQKKLAKAFQRDLGLVSGVHRLSSLKKVFQREQQGPRLIVSLLEYDSVFLDGMSEADFSDLKLALTRVSSIVWVTRHRADTGADPRHALADGLGRVLMSEEAGNKFITLSLSGLQQREEAFSTLVASLVHKTLREPVECTETKYVASGNMLHVSRVYENSAGNSMIAEKTANVKRGGEYSFSSDNTYVIAGGLGGLGRILALWMAHRGARHLVLISRSGARSTAERALLDELSSQGVQAETPLVDISDLGALSDELKRLGSIMPPIKGVIQASVALRDNLFVNMTYEDWIVSTRAKVAGSWNLHVATPKDVDFFILLSSLNGIMGGRAQANYGAGNAFEDALAEHRLRSGLKAVSIDLGLMVSHGVVAESTQLLASMRRIGHLMDINREEFLAIMDYYCDPNLAILDPADAQILVGIELPDAILAKGIDHHHLIRRPMFRHLYQMRTGSGSSVTGEQPIQQVLVDRQSLLAACESHDDAAKLVLGWLSVKVAQALGLSPEDIDVRRPLHTYGMDSLVAIDLKNWLSRETGSAIEVFSLMGNTPMTMLAREIAGKSRYLSCTITSS